MLKWHLQIVFHKANRVSQFCELVFVSLAHQLDSVYSNLANEANSKRKPCKVVIVCVIVYFYSHHITCMVEFDNYTLKLIYVRKGLI